MNDAIEGSPRAGQEHARGKVYRVGTVYLVGAGPGDPELITVRGLRLIRIADVIVHDRLVAPELLDEARLGSEVIDVGKFPGFQRRGQDQINALIVERARRGLSVVRLKGGDPFVFGRGVEEAQACGQAGVPVAVVPGVSSAHAVPAAAGIPVTHRGVGRSYAVVTGHTDPKLGSAKIPYDSLVGVDTVIVLMGRANLDEITEKLIGAGRSASTPAACVEMGWTKHQKTVVGTLGTIATLASASGLQAPVVTVVGEVVALGSALGWGTSLAGTTQQQADPAAVESSSPGRQRGRAGR